MKDRLEQIKAQALSRLKLLICRKAERGACKISWKKRRINSRIKGNERRGPRGASESRTAGQ